MRNVNLFAQGDPRWGSIKMGSSDNSMAGYGCYVTMMAMGLSSYFIKDVDPKILVEWLNANGGFDAAGQLRWDKLSEMFPHTKLVGFAWTTNVPGSRNFAGKLFPSKAIADIQRANRCGQVVGICVDLVENNWAKPDHIVLAVSTPDDLSEWTIADPAFGDIKKFSERYGNLEDGIYGYRLLAGTPANFPDSANQSDIKAGNAIGMTVDDRYTKKNIRHALLSA